MNKLSANILKKFCQILPELWPFEYLGILNLSAIYLKNCLNYGLTLSQLIGGDESGTCLSLNQIPSNIPGVIALCKNGYFKLVKKISRNVF